jgi:N6-adenosine-specific RNA methylase IME4
MAGRQITQWAKKITEVWRETVFAVIETGRLLMEAKEELEHGEFAEMVETALPFGPRTAQRLMKIAADKRLAKPTHVSLLPPSWGTLYELTKLSDEAFKANIDNGTIRPDMERKDAAKIEKRERRHERERELGQRQMALPDRRYGVVYADPEWRFETYSEKGKDATSADNHYPTSTLEEIKARDVPGISADDCSLFLWATVPMLPQALEVMEAWGFAYKTHWAWVKDRTGTGYWNLNQHELLLLGTKGAVPAPTQGTQGSSVINAPRREHSRKPDEAYDLIEKFFPSLPKIELNQRYARPGWDGWGNETPVQEDAT